MLFRERVRERRRALKLNQEQLAALVGVERRSISMYENGGAFPRRKKLFALAKSLGVSVRWLTGADEDAPTSTPNMIKVGPKLYIVRTQAGFRKAFKQHASDDWDWSWRDKNAYPKAYPALIQIDHYYDGGIDRLTMRDLTPYLEAIAPHIAELTGPRRPAPEPKPPREKVKK